MRLEEMGKYNFVTGCIVLICMLVGIGNFADRIRVQSDSYNAKQQSNQIQQDNIRVADERLKQGCYLVTQNGVDAVNIAEGMAVFGFSTPGQMNTLADNTFVCDAWGGTGVMKGGVVTLYAQSANSPYLKTVRQQINRN